MPYRFLQNERVRCGVQRIVAEQIDRALRDIDDDALERHDTVHQIRKRCKRIRGVLRLLRGDLDEDRTYSDENTWYRDAARTLSSVRDAKALLECYDELATHFDDQVDRRALGRIRRRFTLRREEIADNVVDLDERLARFRGAMTEGRDRVSRWPVVSEEFDALGPGLVKTYKRGRKALANAFEERTDEAFHEWRKRAKYHWYHIRLLRDAWGPVLTARRDAADDLASLLGDDHDLAVMRATIADAPGDFADTETRQVLFGLIDRRRAEIQARARPLGKRLYAEKPEALARRLRAYWETWRSQPAKLRADAAELAPSDTA